LIVVKDALAGSEIPTEAVKTKHLGLWKSVVPIGCIYCRDHYIECTQCDNNIGKDYWLDSSKRCIAGSEIPNGSGKNKASGTGKV